MTSQPHVQGGLPPAPAEKVALVEEELRRSWWPSTLALAAPFVVAVLVGYLVVLEVADGDLLALLFPGVVAVAAAWWGWRLASRAVGVKREEAALDPAARGQAVYVRGLTGTSGLAARQDPDALAVLSTVWDRELGRVVEVRAVRTVRGLRSVRVVAEVDVRLRGGATVTAALAVPPGRLPRPRSHVRLLVDPHHPRAVVDLGGEGRR